jgi:N-acetylglucosamine-6-phosphate deacetylase
MASFTPARWLRLRDRGVLGVGAFADWCQFDEHFQLRRVVVKGQNTHV